MPTWLWAIKKCQQKHTTRHPISDQLHPSMSWASKILAVLLGPNLGSQVRTSSDKGPDELRWWCWWGLESLERFVGIATIAELLQMQIWFPHPKNYTPFAEFVDVCGQFQGCTFLWHLCGIFVLQKIHLLQLDSRKNAKFVAMSRSFL